MMTMPPREDDPGLQVATDRLAEAQRALVAAQAARAALGLAEAGRVTAPTLRVLQADDAVDQAEARLAESTKIHEVAQYQRGVRLRAAYRDRALTDTRAALSAARTVATTLAEELANRQHLAAALGLADSGAHPHPAAAQLVAVLEHRLRELDPPPPAPAPPPRPGYVRVQVRSRFMDLSGGWHYPDFAGQPLGPEELPAKDAEVALREGWAVTAEGEA